VTGNKIYTIIGGVNGTGKSSFTGVLERVGDNLGVVIDADRIARENACSAYRAGKIAVRKIADCLSQGASFTQETTLSGLKTLKTIQAAKEKGYKIRLYYISLDSLDESIKRIANRVAKGGHNIDNETVRRRYENKSANLERILPYCDEVHFFNNENGFVKEGDEPCP
jgi:predicted ABC-type ATPase